MNLSISILIDHQAAPFRYHAIPTRPSQYPVRYLKTKKTPNAQIKHRAMLLEVYQPQHQNASAQTKTTRRRFRQSQP